jgi:hypothetical protein
VDVPQVVSTSPADRPPLKVEQLQRAIEWQYFFGDETSDGEQTGNDKKDVGVFRSELAFVSQSQEKALSILLLVGFISFTVFLCVAQIHQT